jgi:hypothetical protein
MQDLNRDGEQQCVVLGDQPGRVAVPQEISAAENYNCLNCVPYTLATQLFRTRDGQLRRTPAS